MDMAADLQLCLSIPTETNVPNKCSLEMSFVLEYSKYWKSPNKEMRIVYLKQGKSLNKVEGYGISLAAWDTLPRFVCPLQNMSTATVKSFCPDRYF